MDGQQHIKSSGAEEIEYETPDSPPDQSRLRDNGGKRVQKVEKREIQYASGSHTSTW